MADIPTSYSQALSLYDERRKRGILDRGVKLANNTYLEWDDREKPMTSGGLVPGPSWFAVKLHRTNVVTFHSDGSIVLDSGGWKTTTTKQRMNLALDGWSVYSERGVWYLSHRGDPDGECSLTCNGREVDNSPGHRIGQKTLYPMIYARVTGEWESPYGWVDEVHTTPKFDTYDWDYPYKVPFVKTYGWTISAREAEGTNVAVAMCPKCGKMADYIGESWRSWAYEDDITIHPDGTVTGEGVDPKAQAKLRRRAKAYAKAYVDHLYSGEMPAPGNGDCWGCLMVPTDKQAGPHAGMAGPDHMLSHLEEKYYVPSLVVRALDRFGASRAAKHDLAVLFNPEQAKAEGVSLWPGTMKDQILRAVRRHVYEQLGLGV